MSENSSLAALLPGIDILALAKQIARPTWLLDKEGVGELAGIWGGQGIVDLPPKLVVTDEQELDDGAFFLHWISVRADLLPLEPKSLGVVSVYFNDDEGRGIALHDPLATLHITEGGQHLYASRRADLPHADALYMQLTSDQQKQLADTFETSPAILEGQVFGFPHEQAKALDKALVGDHPFWAQQQPFAQIGGYPWGWPDAEWNEREKLGQTLALWTFQDSEPWLEVWWTGAEFEVVAHIT